ncbi:MAG: hypothetical protein ETSY1_45325, partial [Candidatus Entotheonella factor]
GLGYLPSQNGMPDLLFRGTTTGELLALDPKDGKILWATKTADPFRGESIVAAPIAVEGKVFVGIATSELGVCGRVMAFNAYTGEKEWTAHTIFDIKKKKDGTVTCNPQGGAQWTSLSFNNQDDGSRDKGFLFVPVANPFPDFVRADGTAGTLYTNSVIRIDANTGKINLYYQVLSHDVHDWDLGTAPVLYRTASGTDMLAIAGKDGFIYGVERKTFKLVYKTSGTQHRNIDKPFPFSHDFPPSRAALRVCPGVFGGAQFTGPSYDPNSDNL